MKIIFMKYVIMNDIFGKKNIKMPLAFKVLI